MRHFFYDLLNRMSPLRFVLLLLVLVALIFALSQIPTSDSNPLRDATSKIHEAGPVWQAPDTATIPQTPEGNLIRYGRKLIANTAYYLGPKGVVAKISNAMNCQNCHMNGGAKPYGNSFSAVASIYPVFRSRSGIVESIEFRINDCMLRSMNGQNMDTTSREMHAMVAYLKWIGKDVQKGIKPKGAGLVELPYLSRASQPLKGKTVYINKCITCHGKNGEGMMKPTGEGFIYPPLWGPQSYNTGAGLFRMGRFAGFVKHSMPLGTTYDQPQLSDEEAWDVAAFVNSQPRPEKTFAQDWPDIRKKAVDYPYGPYADNFSEDQHKYGPYRPIKKVQDSILRLNR